MIELALCITAMTLLTGPTMGEDHCLIHPHTMGKFILAHLVKQYEIQGETWYVPFYYKRSAHYILTDEGLVRAPGCAQLVGFRSVSEAHEAARFEFAQERLAE